jgi:hypothetical protein
MIDKYTIPSASATHMSLQAQNIAVVDTDWPVQHWSHVYKY